MDRLIKNDAMTQNRRQKVFNRGPLRLCGGTRDSEI